ncbi:hypothetical protein [Streptomyces sp. NPDC057686]
MLPTPRLRPALRLSPARQRHRLRAWRRPRPFWGGLLALSRSPR